MDEQSSRVVRLVSTHPHAPSASGHRLSEKSVRGHLEFPLLKIARLGHGLLFFYKVGRLSSLLKRRTSNCLCNC